MSGLLGGLINFLTWQDSLLEVLRSLQEREDFQWSLHQLGDFNAILFLYGRVSTEHV